MNRNSVAVEQVFEKLVGRQQRGEPCALVLVVDVKGSAPAKTGARMAVFADGEIAGTVGGGSMEKEAIDLALLAMETGKASLHHVDLAKPPDYVCGGRATLYVDPVLPSASLIIAGGGHVGQALCQVASTAGFSVTVVDDREEFAEQAILPGASKVICCNFTEIFDRVQVTPSTYVVCATRGHAHDYTVVSRALNTGAAYIGLVGSRSKKAAFFRRLQQENGATAADLARIYTPVGLNIGAVSPAEIAISITAQLIAVRSENGALNGLGYDGGWTIPECRPNKAAAISEK
ncbi:MAG: XdhC family protein [Desulforhopalus sp.]